MDLRFFFPFEIKFLNYHKIHVTHFAAKLAPQIGLEKKLLKICELF